MNIPPAVQARLAEVVQKKDDREPGDIPGARQQVIETRCEGCIFAICTEELQVACWAGVINKVEEQGRHDIVYEENTDGQVHFVIIDKVCPFHRRKQWWQDRVPSESTLDECLEFIRKHEARLRSDIVIHVPQGATFEDMERTLASIRGMDMKFESIWFCNQSNIKPFTFLNWANINIKDMKWHMEYIMDTHGRDGALTVLYKKCKSMYVTCCEAGYEFEPGYLSRIDSALYDKLIPIIAVVKPPIWVSTGRNGGFVEEPSNDINGYMIMRVVGKQVGFNKSDALIAKLERITRKQECQQMIKVYCDQEKTIQ